MNMKKEEYKNYSEQLSRKSPLVKDCIKAFLIGGAICTVGQLILCSLKKTGMSAEIASALTSVSMIFLGALFTGLNLYDKLAKHAGAGTIVPITGFANSVVSPAIEGKTEGYVMGVGAKMFTVAGPVIVYGVISSVIAGLLIYMFKINVM